MPNVGAVVRLPLSTLLCLFLSGVAAAQEVPEDAEPERDPAAVEPIEPQAEDAGVSIADLGTRLEALERLTLSGYIQVRYLVDQTTELDDPRDGFLLRRARLKTTYDATWSEYVLQIDAVTEGVTLRDAELHLIEPWTPWELALVAGQTKWPFGYEIFESSSVREFPERSRVVRAFAAGERDLGAKLVSNVEFVRFSAGVFNGNGIDDRFFLPRDNDAAKDVVGRAGVDFGWISGGVSFWYGNTRRPVDAIDPDEATEFRYFDRTRIGADLQVRRELLATLGPTELKAEYIAGRTYWEDGIEQAGVPALGWYAVLTQYFGALNALSVRYDYFDPLAGTGAAESLLEPGQPADANAIGTWGVAYSRFWFDHVRLTAAYEIPVTATPEGVVDPDDNLLTLQAQFKY